MLTDGHSIEHGRCNSPLLKLQLFGESTIAKRGNEMTEHAVVDGADHCSGNMTVI
jgi:hypothetical protein